MAIIPPMNPRVRPLTAGGTKLSERSEFREYALGFSVRRMADDPRTR
jgi:hypothetical protein